MKNVGDLTREEAQSLGRAQAELREAALIFANTPNIQHADDLYTAARQFANTCEDIGFKEYWNRRYLDPWNVITPQERSGGSGRGPT